MFKKYLKDLITKHFYDIGILQYNKASTNIYIYIFLYLLQFFIKLLRLVFLWLTLLHMHV